MQIAEIQIEVAKGVKDESRLIEDLACGLTGSWRSNGQVLGREFSSYFAANAYHIILMLPQPDALATHHDSKYVIAAKARFSEAGIQTPKVTILGEDPFSAEPCSCSNHNHFILFTTFVSLESCLRCGDCFGPVPLYVIPPQVTTTGELHDQIMSWQSDYQSCDHLQMNCSTGEKFGLREMSNHDSSLSQRGREICSSITESMGIPTYYYLHRYRGRSEKSEKGRKCPSCGGEWLMNEQWHNLFDFKCEHCRLLSNIALSIQ